MILGIMQPYFFPYPGHFDLVAQVDEWVVFDTPQYIRHGWVNRNRILHPQSGEQYVGVPVGKVRRGTPINEVQISSGADWQDRILRQLDHYRRDAPHHDAAADFVASCLDDPPPLLSELNVRILRRVNALLDIERPVHVFSEMDLDLPPIAHAGEWALRICEAMGATAYVNPPGGRDLFEPEAFAAAGVELKIQEYEPLTYPMGRRDRVDNLSIIDALMWLEPDEISAHLSARTLS